MINIQTVKPDIQLIKVTPHDDFVVTFCSFGASIYDIEMRDNHGQMSSITPHPAQFNDFLTTRKFFGKTLGRLAGRIAHGRLTINNQTYHLPQNENGNTLHGGENSFSFQNFMSKIEEKTDSVDVFFTYFSPDKEEGFPGNLHLEICYSVARQGMQIMTTYRAFTDQETVYNPSNHVYFNLNSHPQENILNHQLYIKAQRVSILENDLCIKGFMDISPIYDFTQPKPVGQDIDNPQLQKHRSYGYDHTWLLATPDINSPAASLWSPTSHRRVIIKTDLPALNVYSGNYPVPELLLANGVPLYRYQSIALEPQLVPGDEKNWIITKEQPFLGHICYVFSISD